MLLVTNCKYSQAPTTGVEYSFYQKREYNVTPSGFEIWENFFYNNFTPSEFDDNKKVLQLGRRVPHLENLRGRNE